MRFKNTLLLLFFLLAGIVLGGMLASVCANVGVLKWMSYAGTIGFNPDSPMVLDLSIVKLTFGFSMTVSVAQVITISIAIVLYSWLKKLI